MQYAIFQILGRLLEVGTWKFGTRKICCKLISRRIDLFTLEQPQSFSGIVWAGVKVREMLECSVEKRLLISLAPSIGLTFTADSKRAEPHK